MTGAEKLLHEFAIWCAMQVVGTWEDWAMKNRPDDVGAPRAAIEAKVRWLAGRATAIEVADAAFAARSARCFTAWDAVRARDAAVAAACLDAYAAFTGAADAAANSAAWSFARASGWSAAGAPAREAAKAAQRDKFFEMLKTELGENDA
jgi:hypothetical protein